MEQRLAYWVLNEDKKLCIVYHMKTHQPSDRGQRFDGVDVRLNLCCTGNTDGYKMYIHPYSMSRSEVSAFCHAVRQGLYSIGYKSATGDIDLYRRSNKFGKVDQYRYLEPSDDKIVLSIEEVNEYVSLLYHHRRGTSEIFNKDECEPKRYEKYAYYIAKNLEKHEYIIGTIKCYDEDLKNLTLEKLTTYLQKHCYGCLSVCFNNKLSDFRSAMERLREHFAGDYKDYLQNLHLVSEYNSENGDHKESTIVKHINYEDL